MQLDALIARLCGRPTKIARFDTLKGDASSRRYHRVVLETGATPTNLIVMELPEDALKSDEATAGGPPGELPFLNVCRHLAAAGIPVPEVYLDAVADGAVLLEDLGDETFARRIIAAGEAGMEAWYGAAVDLLAEAGEAACRAGDQETAGLVHFHAACHVARWELLWDEEDERFLTLSLAQGEALAASGHRRSAEVVLKELIGHAGRYPRLADRARQILGGLGAE